MTNDYIDIIITVLLTREGQLGSPRRDGYLKYLLKSIFMWYILIDLFSKFDQFENLAELNIYQLKYSLI